MPGLRKTNASDESKGQIQMQAMQIAVRTIKYFQPRKTSRAEKYKKEGDLMRSKRCIDCGDHVPAYQNFYCEKCWQKVFKAKLEAEDHAAAIKKQDQGNQGEVNGQ